MEYGAPGLDPKRPFGNSDVAEDVVKLLGWETLLTDDGPSYPLGTHEDARVIVSQLEDALGIILQLQTFLPGHYVREDYGDWRLLEGIK